MHLSVLFWKWFECSCFLFIRTQIMNTHGHNVSLTQIRSTGDSCTSTHSSPWPICYCLAEMYFSAQKACLPTKRQIKRLGLERPGQRQRTWYPAERWPMPWIRRPTSPGQEKDSRRPLAESFMANIGHTPLFAHTPSSSPTLHTLTFKPSVCMRFLCQRWTAGFQNGMCPSIPSGDRCKWRFTKRPQSSVTPDESKGTAPPNSVE